MRKSDNDWAIYERLEEGRMVSINGESYFVDNNTACLAHSLLLLVDAINDKHVNMECNATCQR